MINEFERRSYDEVKSNLGNLIILYHRTDETGAKGIAKNGACREYTGKNSNFYGQGFYTTFTLGSTMNNNFYGSYIIKFGLSRGFKDFLFFDEAMNQKYNGGKPIEEQINELCPPEIVQKLKNENFFEAVKSEMGTHSSGRPLSARGAKKFFEILKGHKLPSKSLTPYQTITGCRLYDELDISKTKVRGYIFVGNNDGEVCVVRDYNDLIPLQMWDPTIGKNPSNPNDEGWIDILNKDTFDNVANSIDASKVRGEYPETPVNEKSICGYILVKGKPSGKYNYLNVKTMKELLPIAADEATAFNPDTNMCKFVIGDTEWMYNSKNDTYFEDGCIPESRDEFVEALKEYGQLNECLSLMKKIIVI